jgi:hypothetical protein
MRLKRSDKITPNSVFISFYENFFNKAIINFKTTLIFVLISENEDSYSAWQMYLNEEEKNSAKRLLRRLRIALIVWVIVFLVTLIWFTLTA